MAEILYTGLVDADKVQQVVAHCHFTQNALFLAEQLPRHLITRQRDRLDLLKFTYVKDSLPCTDYTSGRIFQYDRELRWEKQADRVRLIYLGAEEGSEALQEAGMSEKKELGTFAKRAVPTYYYLFGERLKSGTLEKLGEVAQLGDFAVLRIHRILRYPVEQNDLPYIRLAACDYLEKATGRVVLFRFQQLEPVEYKRHESV